MSDSPLADHPIFDVPDANELYYEVEHDAIRRTLMVTRGSDIILAVGKTLRITSLVDAKGAGSSKASYKTLYAPHVDFNITHISLSPDGKFLAVAGVHQLATVILPRPAYARLPTADVECRSLKIGEYYHTTHGTARIAQTYWHPWGRAGCSLLVMTTDGILREYDVSSQVEEPLQTLYFLPQKVRRRGYQADQGAEQVVSFTFGKGVADWGPLTVYALAKSGDIYAMAPFLPTYADVPSQYLTYLEAFVRAKRDVASRTKGPEGSSSASTAAVYDQQFKYVSALVKQASASGYTAGKGNLAHIQRPESGILAATPARQGPFLLQPEPAEFEDSTSTDACDVFYLSYGFDAPRQDPTDEDSSATVPKQDNLGAILASQADGRIQVFLDLSKIEALWEGEGGLSEEGPALPILSVFETIDLGIFRAASDAGALDLLSDNYIALSTDPSRPQTVFAYHSLGVHTLDLLPWMEVLSSAMCKSTSIGKKAGMNLMDALKQAPNTQVNWVLDTLSDEEKASSPVVAVVPVNNPSIAYHLLAVTSAYEPIPLDLLPTTELARSINHIPATRHPETQPRLSSLPSPYSAAPANKTYDVPSMGEFGRGTTPRNPANRFMSPQTLRVLGDHVKTADGKREALERYIKDANSRMELQEKELERQVDALRKAKARLGTLQAAGQELLEGRLKEVAKSQQELSERMDVLLRKCMAKSNANISEVERQWFAELAELKARITASGRGDTLQERANAVVDRHNLLRKDLAELRAAEPQAKPAVTLGTVQLKSIQSRLSTEDKLLLAAKDRVDNLSALLETVRLSN
ncbi:hypothetical protein FRB90_011299 [Tulasnella sp. 427]|nr:hypothetical protein FRB90_011299 [Tulasnella sp. 427]